MNSVLSKCGIFNFVDFLHILWVDPNVQKKKQTEPKNFLAALISLS